MAGRDKRTGEQSPAQSDRESREVRERLRLRSPLVYRIVSEEGEEELSRPLTSLWWSGVAAGMAISMSVVSEGLLRQHLPDTPWRPVWENFGYSVGFVIVVLGRLQLFTENTVTAVLPVVARREAHSLYRMLRLWGVVFAGNMVGTMIFALAAVFGGLFPEDQVAAFLELAHHFMDRGAADMLLRGIPAGFLIAVMVWMMPSSEGTEFWVVILITYLIALGDMTHVVAGSAEAFLLLLHGDIGVWKTFGGFMVPAFVGNVIGGTALFALLAYGQVKEELDE